MPFNISSSVVPFSSCLQSFLALGCFSMSQFFASGGQSIGVSASASVLPMNIQDSFPSRLTGLISLQYKGLSRVFSNTSSKVSVLWCSAFFFIVQLFVTPMNCSTPAFPVLHQSFLKLMSIESVMPSNYLIFCNPLLLLPSIFSSIRVFFNESALCIRWPKY